MRHQSIDKRAQPSSDLKSRRIHPEGMSTCWYALSSLGLLEARYRLRPDSRPTGFGTWRDTDVVARWQNGDVFQNNNVQSCSLTEFTNVPIPLKMRMMHSGLEKQKHNLCYWSWHFINV
jgi:hypothetical protein